ncbi:MAG: hypothetical protein Q4D29_01735 [Lachnospiraceae bacterium]|nr:hypothetical protein [Lachnospiraceae bacterium]
MTVRERRERTKSRNQKRQMRGQYTYGNVVTKTNPSTHRRNNFRTVEGGQIKRNNEKKSTVTAGYVLFLTVMMCVAGYFCMSYLDLTSSITNDLGKIAKLEAEYNSIKAENDDYENRINGAVDLENIKKIAMNDLSMQYADESQIVKYESDDTDYVRQYISLE